ncbi:hypothetical protein D3C71_2018650 [compost metagenome]
MLLLGQQFVVVLHDRVLHHALDLGRQATFLVEALGVGLYCRFTGSQVIQRVVMISAKKNFAVDVHEVRSLTRKSD